MIIDFKHLSTENFTYFEHMRRGLIIGFYMLGAGVACTIHAFFPFIFTHTASNIVAKLLKEIPNFPAEETQKE